MTFHLEQGVEIVHHKDWLICAYQFPNTENRPFEDGSYFGRVNHDVLIAAVADGVTRSPLPDGSYPAPSPAKFAADYALGAVSNFLQHQSLINEEVLRQAIKVANQVVGNLNDYFLGITKQTVNYQTNDYGGTTLTVLVLDYQESNKPMVYWAMIGDSPLWVIQSNRINRLTPNQTALKDRFAPQLKEQYGLNHEGWRKWYRSTLRNKSFYYEQGDYGINLGFGVLTGEASVGNYIVSSYRPVAPDEVFLLATDGISVLPLDRIRQITQEGIEQRNFELILPNLFGQALCVCEGKGKKSDDMTAILMVPS